jgi:hypothetical protein
MFFLSSCGFNNKFEVPSEINSNVNVAPVTGTVTVRHEIVVSLEMKASFYDECTEEVADRNIPEELRAAAIESCVNAKTTKFITDILALINANGGQ